MPDLYGFRDRQISILTTILEELDEHLCCDAGLTDREDSEEYRATLASYLAVHDRLLALHEI